MNVNKEIVYVKKNLENIILKVTFKLYLQLL